MMMPSYSHYSNHDNCYNSTKKRKCKCKCLIQRTVWFKSFKNRKTKDLSNMVYPNISVFMVKRYWTNGPTNKRSIERTNGLIASYIFIDKSKTLALLIMQKRLNEIRTKRIKKNTLTNRWNGKKCWNERFYFLHMFDIWIPLCFEVLM